MATLKEAVRKHCVECVDSVYAVKDCQGDKMLDMGPNDNHKCTFFDCRMGKGRTTVKKVRKECLWCCMGNRENVDFCSNRECNLHPFRMGKSPGHAHLSFARG